MKKVLVWASALLGGLVLCALGAAVYVRSAAAKKLEQKMDVEVAIVPVPFPLDVDQKSRVIARLQQATEKARAPDDSDDPTAPGEPTGDREAAAQRSVELDPEEVNKAVAEEASRLARERGARYLESRAGCAECHGEDFGGKVIIDALPMMARWVAPNITRGGVTKDYTPADWVRIIRHGVRKDGHVSTMPSRDFTWLSDQEVSDIIAYIESRPAVDRVMPKSEYGPIFSMLIAQGEIPIDAEQLDHEAPRPKLPPELAVSLELGQHLATTCRGCHGPKLAGGPIAGGDPNWPPAANLTPHETGLAGWSKADFFSALREGKRPDGRVLHPSMPIPYTKNLSDEETESLYEYCMKLEPLPIGTR